jgi:hypothetical protein
MEAPEPVNQPGSRLVLVLIFVRMIVFVGMVVLATLRSLRRRFLMVAAGIGAVARLWVIGLGRQRPGIAA